MVRIAVDAMGGDAGPSVVVPAALDAVREARGALEVLLVGREEAIAPHLRRRGRGVRGVDVVPASEVIGMSEPPASAIRAKKDSSIAVATRLVREGRADGLVSAGNTGAVVAASLVTLGRIHGVSRPAIATVYPTRRGGTVVLDVGANHECNPRNLHQFAAMGSEFARFHLDVEPPRVGLLNIGEERSKGNPVVRDAYALLEEDPSIEFVGNVEGRDVFEGAADVVVCDGFVGNVMLKFSESIYAFLRHLLREQIRRDTLSRVGALLMRPAFRRLRAQLDYAEYGGAPLLGVNGVVIIAHGKSSRRALKNAVLVGLRSLEAGLIEHIANRFQGSVDHAANAR